MPENKEIAKIFREIAVYLSIKNTPFKPQAYEVAATEIELLTEPARQIYERGGFPALEAIPGVGASLAEHIEEFLKTGKVKLYEKLKKELPVDVNGLMSVEGVGPKTIKTLYDQLNIKNLSNLEKAAKQGKIQILAGFGKKKEENILRGLEFLKKSSGRFPFVQIAPYVNDLKDRLAKAKGVKKISVAGSFRRGKETIGDIDFLITASDSAAIMDYFVSLPEVEKIWGKGGTRASIRTKYGFDVDLRVVPEKSFGAALQYFTGSKEHNIALRRLAIQEGYKLNEYGMFRAKKMIVCETEEEIYRLLGMDTPAPEIRENQGEIELAKEGKLPRPLELKDIKGDFHVHSNWNGGENSLEELAKRAMEKKYDYLGVSDHTKFLAIEKGLDEKGLMRQHSAVQKLNDKFKTQGKKFRLLHGCETNILKDGQTDIKDDVLAKLDFVIAGVHSMFKMSKSEMTERLIRAMENKNIDIISHPTGRIVGRRDEYALDFDRVLQTAKKTGTILEINSSFRMDLSSQKIRLAKEAGVKMMVNTDTHEKSQMDLMKYGVIQARRGFAEKKDVVNCLPLDKLPQVFKRK